MLDWTDRHCRTFHRLLTHQTLLYSEMITTGAILHGNTEHLLSYGPSEHPLALQLGGSDPAALAACCRLAEQYGYDEVNLNCGCPSDRVQNGAFGACLMQQPQQVAQLMQAMQQATSLPVTVKHRIGVDEMDSYQHLHDFVATLATVGVQVFIVHARKAWLSGLSPKQNREIPPLRYELVQQLKADFPQLTVVINGGVQNLAEASALLAWADGVMIGRAAYQNPYLLAEADKQIFGSNITPPSREQVVGDYLPYVEEQLALGQPLHRLSKPLLGLWLGQRGAKQWKRTLSQEGYVKGAGPEVLELALARVASS